MSADPNEGRCPVSGIPPHCKNSVPCVFPISSSAVAASFFGFQEGIKHIA